MNKTKIEWCDSTWNPVTGCLHGCEYCYAQRISRRFGNGKSDGIIHFLGEPMRCSGFGIDRIDPYPFCFDPTFHHYKLDEPQHMKKCKTIFVCSMADLFGDWVPDEWVEAVFRGCEKAPQHRYLFLTKNPDRYAKLYEQGKLPRGKNMWYGASITDTESLDKVITSLKTIPYLANIFFSIEPILEDIMTYGEKEIMDLLFSTYTKWTIIGAETGIRINKVIPRKEWIDRICASSDIVYMKDSIIPIVGEENMRREFPWRLQ